MNFSAVDHPDFKLNEQQEAVVAFMKWNESTLRPSESYYTSYDLHGKMGKVNGKLVKIGDAGRRMRELREAGFLESRKAGRFEEYRLARGRAGPGNGIADSRESAVSRKEVHSRDEAYELEDRGWRVVERKSGNGLFVAVMER